MKQGLKLRPPIRPGTTLLGLFSLIVGLALAGSLAGEVQLSGGQTVTVAADEVVADDLYATGETVRIEGTVRGDLVAAAREIVIDGIVEGDVLAAGQSVSIRGTVGDDVRIAGQVLRLGEGARLGDDLIAAGFSLETVDGSGIGGTVRFFGYQALLAGEVVESVGGGMGALELAGTVRGDVDVEVGPRGEGAPPAFWPSPVSIPSVPSGLTVADGARIGGTLRYSSSTEGRIAEGAAVDGGVEFDETAAAREAEPGVLERIADRARRFVALLLVGALLLWLAPRWTERLAATVRAKPLASLGWGVVFLAAAAVGGVALALVTIILAWVLGLATLGGLVAAVVGGGVLAELALGIGVVVVSVYLPPVVVGLAGGRAVIAPRFGALALGVLVLLLLTSIPYLGTLIAIFVLLLGLGSLWLWAVGRAGGEPASAEGAGPGF